MKAIETVKAFIAQHGLMETDKLYLVAVSGGADSVCLLLMLQQLGYHVEAVHCNFHLRGDESDRDEAFVKNLCKEHNITLHITHFDTKSYAALHQVSIEMAARTLRYHYFEQLCNDLNADGICVAHHRDDSVETILMNLMRGTGIHGLCGIRPRRDYIIRPLLCLSRADIEQWLCEQHRTFVTDSTNHLADVQRNFLRLDIIPRLQQRWPAANKSLMTTARRLTEAAKVYDAATKVALAKLIKNHNPHESHKTNETNETNKPHIICIAELLAEPSPESILFEWLSPLGFQSDVIELIADRLPQLNEGRTWQSQTHELTVHQKHLLVQHRLQTQRPTLHIPETGTYVYDQNEHFRFSIEEGRQLDTDPNTCCLDADKITFPLTIRPITQGDRFQPLGMEGSRLVSDYLCDQKYSLFQRRMQLVITDPSDRIIWLVDQRPCHSLRLTDNTTRTFVINHF